MCILWQPGTLKDRVIRMALPMKILNRLRSGRDVAAKVLPSRSENMAWVYVYPLLNEKHGFLHRGHGCEEQIVGDGTGNPIKGFLVRHLEIEAVIVEDFHENQRDDLGEPVLDERFTLETEADLEAVLRRWLTDDTTLHIPMDVGYEFELGADLID